MVVRVAPAGALAGAPHSTLSRPASVTGRRTLGTRRAWIAGLDTVLLVAYVALQEPGGATGFVLHEWIGLGFIPLFVLHLVLSRRWIVATWHRLWKPSTLRARINFLLNLSLFTMMSIVIVSGLVVSEYALPAAGVHTAQTQRWEQLHNFTSSLIAPIIALHLALNWDWIVRTALRYSGRSAPRPAEAREDAA